MDFSPVLAFLTLNVFTNAAEALPAEPRDGTEYKQSVDALRGTYQISSLYIFFSHDIRICSRISYSYTVGVEHEHNKFVVLSCGAEMKLSVKQRVAMRREMKRLKQIA